MSGERILVVEDNEKNRKLARDVLEHHGYRIEVAVSAEEGIERVAAQPPDLILMDIQLPGMDGITAFRLLREDAKTGAIPILAFTASVMTEDRQRILDAGFDGFLAKPISVSEMVATIQSVLSSATDQ